MRLVELVGWGEKSVAKARNAGLGEISLPLLGQQGGEGGEGAVL